MNKNQKDVASQTAGFAKYLLPLCFILVAGVLIPGCGQQKASQPTGSTDRYTLVSVDGKPVPASISHEGVPLKVLSGTFTLNPDGTCSTRTTFVPPSGSEVSRDANATYTRTGSTLTMSWQGAGTTTGALHGNDFFMTNEGMAFVYRK